jgi:hypothetical protein
VKSEEKGRKKKIRKGKKKFGFLKLTFTFAARSERVTEINKEEERKEGKENLKKGIKSLVNRN